MHTETRRDLDQARALLEGTHPEHLEAHLLTTPGPLPASAPWHGRDLADPDTTSPVLPGSPSIVHA